VAISYCIIGFFEVIQLSIDSFADVEGLLASFVGLLSTLDALISIVFALRSLVLLSLMSLTCRFWHGSMTKERD
jgi:hypothetical protein